MAGSVTWQQTGVNEGGDAVFERVLGYEEEEEARATAAAEEKAKELGVDLSQVEGSGKGGRITVGDVEAAAGG